MEIWEIVRLGVLIIHFLGMAGLIGGYFVQARRRSTFNLRLMLTSAVVQVVSGFPLIASREIQHLPVISEKMIVKLLIALVVLAAVIIAYRMQRRLRTSEKSDRPIKPWITVAGLLAIGNVAIAVMWT